MRLEDLLTLGQSRSRSELKGRLLGLMNDLGFERMVTQVFVDGRLDPPALARVDNLPAAYLQDWSSPGAGSRCPVMQHLKWQHTAIVYGRQTYEQAGAGSLWEHQALFGFAAGVAAALHLPNGRHLALGFARDQPIDECPGERLRLTGRLHTILAHAATPALSLLDGAAEAPVKPPSLTAREREVLQWTLLGKSTSMTAEITGLSFGTVNFHLRNAMRKLGCHNKHVAACRAQSLGLITV